MCPAKLRTRCCRVCLKRIRNRTAFTELQEPPDPIVCLRNGIKASSYLQCYHFCLKSNSSHFNIVNLPDYSYICRTCKGQLLITLNFIVQSQKNELFLMSMYDIGKDDSVSADFEYLMKTSTKEEDNISSDEGESVEHMVEENVDERRISEEDPEDVNFCEKESHLKVCTVEYDNVVDDNAEREDHITLDDLKEEVLEDTVDTLELFENVIIQDNSDASETETVSEHEYSKTTQIMTKDSYFHFKCVLCTKSFKLQRLLFGHYDKEHDQISLDFPCDICKKRHISHKALVFHKRHIHNNIGYDDCRICGKLVLPGFSKTHKERHKRDVKYVCGECDRIFATEITLKQHHRAVHGKCKLRQYKCPDCERYFFSPEKLKSHRQAHAKNNVVNEGGFLCHICSKTFARKHSLKLHLKFHNGETMKCPHCDKVFVRTKDLEVHVRIHTKDFPFKCNVCCREFAVRWNMETHMKQHEGVRYKCSICNKEYMYPDSLRKHAFEHTGWPFTCKLCDRGFAILSKMRRHLKNVHRNQFDGEYSDLVANEYYVQHNIVKISSKEDDAN